ncbi:MAG: hypothetical protein ACRD03_04565 [Acidimicrobiales bacterium]
MTWTNRDLVDHVVVGTGWALETLRPGDAGTLRFAAEGTYPYSCPLHPGMNGVVVVGGGAGGGMPEAVELGAASALAAGRAPASPDRTGSSGALEAGAAGAVGGVVAGLAGGRMWHRSRRRG